MIIPADAKYLPDNNVVDLHGIAQIFICAYSKIARLRPFLKAKLKLLSIFINVRSRLKILMFICFF